MTINERNELARLISSRHTMGAVDAILAAGYRKPRTISTAEELDSLPEEAIIRDDQGHVWERWDVLGDGDDWEGFGGRGTVELPAVVLWEAPDA